MHAKTYIERMVKDPTILDAEFLKTEKRTRPYTPSHNTHTYIDPHTYSYICVYVYIIYIYVYARDSYEN